MTTNPPIFLVSACLVGLTTRYDGQVKPSEACRRSLAGAVWIPVCPEQLGGLPTPRISSDLAGGDGFDVLAGKAKVVRKDQVDVSEHFLRGAEQVLAIARSQPVAGVYLKSGSPSCGLTPLTGVTAALLIKSGFEVIEF